MCHLPPQKPLTYINHRISSARRGGLNAVVMDDTMSDELSCFPGGCFTADMRRASAARRFAAKEVDAAVARLFRSSRGVWRFVPGLVRHRRRALAKTRKVYSTATAIEAKAKQRLAAYERVRAEMEIEIKSAQHSWFDPSMQHQDQV